MRVIILITIGFLLGYFTKEYLILNNVTTNNIVSTVTGVQDDSKSKIKSDSVMIIYENGEFKPNIATIKLGNRITIKNGSNALMWLVSDYSKLSTRRSYGKSEQISFKTDKIGTFEVKNKLNLDAKATIIITD